MLMSLLIAVGLMGGMSITFSSLMSGITKESKRASIKLSMITTKNTLLTGLMSDKIWSESMSNPANMAAGNCFQNPLSPCANNMIFQLFDTNNRALTANANLNPGFTHDGRKCTGFDSINGNRMCPIGVNLRLEKICATPCLAPILKVSMDFSYKHPNKKYTFNMNRLSTHFMRSGSSSNIMAEEKILNSGPCLTSIPFGNVMFCQGEIVRTINLDREAYLMLSSSVEVEFQPAGPAESMNLNEKSLELFIEINDVRVASDKTVSDTQQGIGSEDLAQRSSSTSWIQKVGPGTVKLKSSYNGWIVWKNTAPPFPRKAMFNLSYLIYK